MRLTGNGKLKQRSGCHSSARYSMRDLTKNKTSRNHIRKKRTSRHSIQFYFRFHFTQTNRSQPQSTVRTYCQHHAHSRISLIPSPSHPIQFKDQNPLPNAIATQFKDYEEDITRPESTQRDKRPDSQRTRTKTKSRRPCKRIPLSLTTATKKDSSCFAERAGVKCRKKKA